MYRRRPEGVPATRATSSGVNRTTLTCPISSTARIGRPLTLICFETGGSRGRSSRFRVACAASFSALNQNLKVQASVLAVDPGFEPREGDRISASLPVDHLAVAASAGRARCREEVDRFEDVTFALAVVAEQYGDRLARLQREPNIVPEVDKHKLAENHRTLDLPFALAAPGWRGHQHRGMDGTREAVVRVPRYIVAGVSSR